MLAQHGTHSAKEQATAGRPLAHSTHGVHMSLLSTPAYWASIRLNWPVEICSLPAMMSVEPVGRTMANG